MDDSRDIEDNICQKEIDLYIIQLHLILDVMKQHP